MFTIRCPFISGHRLYLSKFKHKTQPSICVTKKGKPIPFYLFCELNLGLLSLSGIWLLESQC